jgi:hypothetical protein
MRNVSIRAVLFALAVLVMSFAMSSASFAQVRISVRFGPPPLPVYEQPACPGEGYLWTPGYWAWGDDMDDYYWVPGTWVEAPEAGYLWTPPYWGWEGGAFLFHAGYWGPHIGFYGGINYGFGYTGEGFEGGRWDRGHFFYNRSVTNVNVVNIHNVYNTTVINRNVTRVSYNGGNGGITARPTAHDEEAARERHVEAVNAQVQHRQEARENKDLRASENHGKPPIAATDKPSNFHTNVVASKEAGGAYNPPADRGANKPRAGEPRGNDNNANENHSNEHNGNQPRANEPRANEPSPSNPVRHPNDLPKTEQPAPHTGNEKMDKKYEQQQEKMQQQQDKQRQKLQEQQDKEHQKMQKQNVNEARQQQVEQKHQQQTEKLQQKQTQQQQKLERKEAPRSEPKDKESKHPNEPRG